MYYMDKVTKEYPLTRDQVMYRDQSSDVGGAAFWTTEILDMLGVYEVLPREVLLDCSKDQKIVDSDPVEIDGVWYRSYIVVDRTPEELAVEQVWNDDEMALFNTISSKVADLNTPPSAMFMPGIKETENGLVFDYTIKKACDAIEPGFSKHYWIPSHEVTPNIQVSGTNIIVSSSVLRSYDEMISLKSNVAIE